MSDAGQYPYLDVLFADTYDYTKLLRYNINPAPLYADGRVRAHAHIGHLGEGDVDFDRIFKTLREIGFNEQEDTIATFNPLGFPERAISDGTRTREIIEENLVGVPSIMEPVPEGYEMCRHLIDHPFLIYYILHCQNHQYKR